MTRWRVERRSPVKWSEADTLRFIQLHNEGAGYEELADIFGRPVGSVASKATQLRHRGLLRFRKGMGHWRRVMAEAAARNAARGADDGG